MKRIFRYTLNFFLLLIALILLWVIALALKTPANDAPWQTQFQVLPTAEIQNDTISLNNVRNFRYNKDESIAKVQYLDQTYQLSEFKNAWYGISHFGENGLAHVLLSFEFTGDKFLVVSIEARLQEKDVDGYHPIKGLFGFYTKTIVLATEQDVIGLRTHVRDEPFYLYKLNIPELYTKALLLNYLRKAQSLNTTPTFYNSIINNCMTGLLSESQQFKSITSWMDKRIFLPGNSDEMAYELSYINTSEPFTIIREKALVIPSITELEDVNFSRKIRQ